MFANLSSKSSSFLTQSLRNSSFPRSLPSHTSLLFQTSSFFPSSASFASSTCPLPSPSPSPSLLPKQTPIPPPYTSLSSNWLILLAAALGLTAASISADENSSNDSSPLPPALSPSEWRPLTLQSIHSVNHNTKLFRFKFENSEQLAGLSVASCLCVRVFNEQTNEFDVRPYTPVSSPDCKGYLDLLIKKYDTGKVTPKIFALKEGDTLEFQGPFKKIDYKPNMKKEIGMIAGGTGITPMLQVVKEILRNRDDKTFVSLIFANISENDILLRHELNTLNSYFDNFQVYYTLDKPPADWPHGRGFVNEAMIRDFLPPPNDHATDRLIMVCGPDPMVNYLAGPKGPNYTQGELGGLLARMGYTEDQVFKF